MARREPAMDRGGARSVPLLDWDGNRWTVSRAIADPGASMGKTMRREEWVLSRAAVARLLVSRYGGGISPSDQVEALRAEGIGMSRSALAKLLQQAASFLAPLADMLHAAAAGSEIIAATNRPVGQGQLKRLWLYLALPSITDRHMEGRGAIASFRLTVNRHGGFAAHELAKFQGYLLASRDNGYDAVFARPDIGRVGCWEEVRRRLAKLDPGAVHPASAAIFKAVDGILSVDKALEAGGVDTDRLRQRQELAQPHLGQLKSVLEQTVGDGMAAHSVRRFASQLLDDWTSYTVFLEDRRLAPNGAAAETLLNAYAEQKWVFGRDRDSHAALANMATIIETCRLNGVETVAYFTQALGRVADEKWLLPWQFP